MSDTSIAGRLASHPFFEGFTPKLVDLLATGTTNLEIGPGRLLLRAGEPANSFYLIERGHVSIEIHHPKLGAIPIQTMGPGETVGWSWIVPPYSWEFDARASQLVRGLCLDAAFLRKHLETDHELCLHLFPKIVRMMASRLTASRWLLLDLYR
jgi:CRP-like cAMP-binding protein